MPCTAEQFQVLCELIGGDVGAENCVSRIIERLESPGDSESVNPAVDLQAELAAAREEIVHLSSRVPPVLPPEAEAAIAESATAKFDAAVNRGFLSPAARDQLVAMLVRGGDGRANMIALSRAANPGRGSMPGDGDRGCSSG